MLAFSYNYTCSLSRFLMTVGRPELFQACCLSYGKQACCLAPVNFCPHSGHHTRQSILLNSTAICHNWSGLLPGPSNSLSHIFVWSSMIYRLDGTTQVATSTHLEGRTLPHLYKCHIFAASITLVSQNTYCFPAQNHKDAEFCHAILYEHSESINACNP